MTSQHFKSQHYSQSTVVNLDELRIVCYCPLSTAACRLAYVIRLYPTR